MNILFIEDNTVAAGFRFSLERRGHKVRWVDNLADAEYYLFDDPNAPVFDALILDLDLNRRCLPPEMAKKAKREGLFSGWVFYTDILQRKPEQRQRTILFSGFVQRFRNQLNDEEKFASLLIVDKNNVHHDQVIFSFLNSISEESAGTEGQG